jgi:hypothetical protein
MGSHTECLTLSISESPKDAEESLLSDVLETGSLHQRFFLSQIACQGILRRAENRGKKLPTVLKDALMATASKEQLEHSVQIPTPELIADKTHTAED